MTTDRTLVVIGASLAGAKAAEAAREAGFEGRVLLVGDEPALPYERPPLSKAVLRGEEQPVTAQVHPDGYYAEHDIDLRTGRTVQALDVAERVVRLDDGEPVGFDRAVLATGARPRRLDVPGSDLTGIHYLRTLDESVALRDAIGRAGRIAVVGAGWIGSEVAASARQTGADVVLIDPAPTPLLRVLGTEVGTVFARLHADHGVELRLGRGVRELQGSGAVDGVVLDDGQVEAADLVVVGVGVVPRVDIAEAAGLTTDNGVVVDEYLETCAPGIFAAGDVANAWHPHYQRRLRVEHWANALNQGAAAGRNTAGERTAYDRLPYFYSDQYDLGLEYVGYADPDDGVVIRGSLDRREFIAFWQREGLVTAAMNVNVWDVVDDLKAIIGSGKPVDPARLSDAATPLGDLG